MSENIDDQLKAAELAKRNLEIAALKRDAERADHRQPWYETFTQLLPILSAALAVAGFLWGVKQYRDQQQQNASTQADQFRQAKEANEKDLMKPWLDAQRDIYSQALNDAAVCTNSSDADARQKAKDDFWALYQGKMILVETTPVSDSMVDFGKCIDGLHHCGQPKMNTLCRSLGSSMASSMATTASLTYVQFAANQFKYSANDGSALAPSLRTSPSLFIDPK